jgi:hypothetical protein
MVCTDIEITSWNENCGDQWLPKTCDWLRLHIHLKKFRDIKRVLNITFVIDNNDEKVPVILISHGEYLTIIALFDVVHLNVSALKYLLKDHVVVDQAISLELKILIFIVDDGNALLGIISDDYSDDVHLCVDEGS